MSILNLEQVTAGYGAKEVIKNVSFSVDEGDCIAIIGPNGSGKSTVLKSVFGLLKLKNGEINYWGRGIGSPRQNLIRGLHYFPQSNNIFLDLTVKENLLISAYPTKKMKNKVGDILDLLPILKPLLNKHGYELSGGEKQITALARIMINDPKLIMFDEPSIGLSPEYRIIVMDQLRVLNKELKLTLMVVEQKVEEAIRISNRIIGIKLGRIEFDIDSQGGDQQDEGIQKLLKRLFLS